MLSNEYVAGLFDGEGYLSIRPCMVKRAIHYRYQVHTGIANTYLPIIEALHAKFGGSLYVNDSCHRKNSAHRISYHWRVVSQRAYWFFEQVLPHLIVKRDEVTLAMKLQGHIWEHERALRYSHGKHPDRDRIYAERQRMADELMALKKRTFDFYTEVTLTNGKRPPGRERGSKDFYKTFKPLALR
jgi:hypothetical protein